MKPKPLPLLTPKDIARFWNLVRIGAENECWIWKSQTVHLYPLFNVAVDGEGRKSFQASRVAYLISNARDPHPLIVLHSCDNPLCVNPKHLSIGTTGDNVQDCVSKGRASAGERHSVIMRRCAALGERSSSSKLKTPEVLSIREEYARGITVTELGRRFKVTANSISAIVQMRTWRHV